MGWPSTFNGSDERTAIRVVIDSSQFSPRKNSWVGINIVDGGLYSWQRRSSDYRIVSKEAADRYDARARWISSSIHRYEEQTNGYYQDRSSSSNPELLHARSQLISKPTLESSKTTSTTIIKDKTNKQMQVGEQRQLLSDTNTQWIICMCRNTPFLQQDSSSNVYLEEPKYRNALLSSTALLSSEQRRSKSWNSAEASSKESFALNLVFYWNLSLGREKGESEKSKLYKNIALGLLDRW